MYCPDKELDVFPLRLLPQSAHLIGCHFEFVFHVDLGSGQKDVDAGMLRRPHGLPGSIHIPAEHMCQHLL